MALNHSLLQGNNRLAEAAEPGGRSIKKAPPHDDADAVRRIQKALHQLGFSMRGSFPQGFDKEPDGQFGQETFNQVIAFQKRAFPNAFQEWDGRVGPKTLQALDQQLNGGSVVPSAPEKKPDPPHVNPSGTTTQVVPQPAGELFLISMRKDKRSKPDLDSSARAFVGSPFARGRVAVNQKLPTFELQKLMRIELILAGPVGLAMLDTFINNTTPAAEKTVPHLATAVSSSAPFLAEARDLEARLAKNLRAQFAAGLVDYHDLVTGIGPDRTELPSAAPIEPGRATRRMLPSLDLGLFGYDLTQDPVLKIVVGSFQGISLFLKNFQVDLGNEFKPSVCRGTLVYKYYDHFGCDDSDVEVDRHGHGSPGQAAMWVLQHDRHTPGHFPFVSVCEIERRFSINL